MEPAYYFEKHHKGIRSSKFENQPNKTSRSKNMIIENGTPIHGLNCRVDIAEEKIRELEDRP